VLEVKTVEGLGTTVDVVLMNGTLKEGDRVVLCGLSGAIVTRIKSLKTPQPLKEMRVKGALVDHKEVSAAIGVKVVAPGMETAVAGTQLFVVTPEDDEDELKDAAQADMADIFAKIDKTGHGVCVQASTLGSLEALLAFLGSADVGIPVSGINLGPVHKRDVLRANVMAEKGFKKFAVLLCFDVPVTKDARDLAAEYGVTIFTSDIIYHLHDAFKEWIKRCRAEEQEAARHTAVFPCRLKPIAACVFNNKSPIVMGVDIVEGVAKVGTPLCVPSRGGFSLGRIASMELDHKAVDVARAGQSVAMKIEAGNATEAARVYGRHFDATDELVSKVSRESIDALKEHFREAMTKDDWRLVVKLKAMFQIN
jgi:translation initiation factor 5B